MVVMQRSITARPYTTEDDEGIRKLIVASYTAHGRVRAWTPARFDALRHGRFWRQELSNDRSWMDDLHVWVMHDSFALNDHIVGVVHGGDGADGEIVLAVDPSFSSIEDEMIEWAEAHFTQRFGDIPLRMDVADWDTRRQELLRARGWTRSGPAWLHRTRRLVDAVSPGLLPAGYSIRKITNDAADQRRHCTIINAVFQRDISIETMPFIHFRPTPHEYWAVVTAEGAFAAWCGIWFDMRNRWAEFEPVGTHPDYRRQGLARAITMQGMKRMRAMGMRMAFVASWHDAEANRFYDAIGMPVRWSVSSWVKLVPCTQPD